MQYEKGKTEGGNKAIPMIRAQTFTNVYFAPLNTKIKQSQE